MAKTSAAYRLKQLATDAPDSERAALIAESFTEKERLPYRFLIDHDIRSAACRKGGPKTGRCPVRYDWAHKEHVGIETMSKIEAELWVKAALLSGYMVGYADKHYRLCDEYTSLSLSKRVAHFARVLNDDEDIPF